MNEMVNQVVVPSLEFLKVGAPSVLIHPTVDGNRLCWRSPSLVMQDLHRRHEASIRALP